jgi:hypothetical protein
MPQDQILGRGKVYFNQFATGTKVGTGEKYLGNTPAFSLARADTALDHYDADEGLKVKDISVTLQSDMTGTIQTDNISVDNLALWFSGDLATVTQAAAAGPIAEPHTVQKGQWYQLGVDAQHPAGVTNVTTVTFKDDASTPAAIDAGNFTVDLVNGRFMVNADAADVEDGDLVNASYGLAAASFQTVISKGQQVYGALRFISANAYGPQRNYFAPYVKLTADGDFALKGDDWQTMSFTVEILKLDDVTERMYINGVPA